MTLFHILHATALANDTAPTWAEEVVEAMDAAGPTGGWQLSPEPQTRTSSRTEAAARQPVGGVRTDGLLVGPRQDAASLPRHHISGPRCRPARSPGRRPAGRRWPAGA